MPIPFFSIPAHIRNEIVQKLDLTDFIRFSQVSRHAFHASKNVKTRYAIENKKKLEKRKSNMHIPVYININYRNEELKMDSREKPFEKLHFKTNLRQFLCDFPVRLNDWDVCVNGVFSEEFCNSFLEFLLSTSSSIYGISFSDITCSADALNRLVEIGRVKEMRFYKPLNSTFTKIKDIKNTAQLRLSEFMEESKIFSLQASEFIINSSNLTSAGANIIIKVQKGKSKGEHWLKVYGEDYVLADKSCREANGDGISHKDAFNFLKMADRGPPLQFIPANGSSFCLLSNEYDKNTYARCGYVGNRTLLKCNEVRRKEELAKNNGICEIHIDFRNNIKETFQLEKLHLANDCPPKNVKKEKFYRSFHTDELALDENPFFTPVDAWFPRTVPNIYEKKVNNDIFSSGYDGVFSEKELLLMQIDIAKKELRELEAYQERHRSTAANLAKELNSEKSKTQKLSGIQAKHYMALLNCGKTSRDEKRIAFMANGPYPDLRKPCVFGMHEEEVIALTLCDIVGKVASDGQKNPVKPKCSGYALPRTEFCLQHIHTDSKVKFPFSKCVMCKNVVLFEGQNLCIVHQNTARGFMKSLKRRVVDTNSVVIDQDDMELFLKEKELEAKKERENAAKKARRTVVAPRNISFTSVSPAQHSASSMATHILSMYKGDEVKEEQPPKKRPAVLTFTSGMDAARCRPFTKEYFGKKETTASTRTTLPYGTPPVLPTTMVPLQRASTLATTIPGSSSDLSARVMNFPRPGLQQTYQTTRPKAAMPRMSQMDRIRNRMQQEEDQKAAASILDDRPDSLSSSTAPEATYRTGQYRVIRDNGIVKPRAPPNRANAAPRFTVSQRHQIAPVEVPTPSRQFMVPPHRLRPHAHAPAAPPPAAAPPRPAQQPQPRMIPLERQGPSVDMKGLSGSGKNIPIPPLEELLAQGRKSPAAVAKRPETPDSAKDLVRKRVKEQLPLPKFPAASRMRTTIPQPLPSYSSNRNPGQTGPRILQNHPPQRIQTLPNRIPAPSRAAPLSPLPVAPVSLAPNQRPLPSQIPSQSRGQGQRRSSRLSTSETKDSADPLSLLADVSAAVSQPHEEDEYEEEL